MIKNNFEYEVHEIISDENGRFTILDITVENIRFSVANIYAPNKDSPEFFLDLAHTLEQLP